MNRLISFLLLSWVTSITSFSASSRRTSSVRLFSTQRNEDFPPEDQEEYTGSVDWDAEWKKVVASEGKVSTDRPGKDFYKSEAEIAAIKAANKAAEQAALASRNVANLVPDIRSLSGDWKVSWCWRVYAEMIDAVVFSTC
jgi:hypothetical protein